MRYINAINLLSSIDMREYPYIKEIIYMYAMNAYRDDKICRGIIEGDIDPYSIDPETLPDIYLLMCSYVVMRMKSSLIPSIHYVSAIDDTFESLYLRQGNIIVSCLTDNEINMLDLQWYTGRVDLNLLHTDQYPMDRNVISLFISIINTEIFSQPMEKNIIWVSDMDIIHM
jgi:hypothetical protein